MPRRSNRIRRENDASERINVEVAVTTPRHHQVGWPLAEHLVGDPIAFQPSVLRLGLHRSLRHERAHS
jgi:hypothetical protein